MGPMSIAQVTVGMPTYNGAETIEEALTCVLEGSLQNIRVLVSDNGSTDATIGIVENIAAKDKRVRLVRQSENIGMVPNFLYLVEACETPFFAWRAIFASLP